MSDSHEGFPKPNPAEVLAETITQRQAELEYLLTGLREGLEVIGDLDQVNARILASSRPDLVMTQPAPQLQIEGLYDLREINNFIPSIRAFGIPIYEDSPWREGKKRFAGRCPPTREELDELFFLGARGSYDEHYAFAEANGIDRSRASYVLHQTHGNKPAFMRMWILFPELTETIINNCLDTTGRINYKSDSEEIFVAYSLMSRLVDINDPGAVKEDGTIDNWLLCH